MREPADVVTLSALGLHCPQGEFHIDPWGQAEVAVISHAHTDRCRPGSLRYVCAAPGLPLVRQRLGPEAEIRAVEYGEVFPLGRARVSLHASGHILGAAQVRIELDGERWVVTGDFKRAPDPTCARFERVACDVLVSEATFGLPIYRWEPTERVVAEVFEWWSENPERPSVLFIEAWGAAQRLLAELGYLTDRTVLIHPALDEAMAAYRAAGVAMLPSAVLDEARRARELRGALVLAPPSLLREPWRRKLAGAAFGFAGGHVRVGGTRRRLRVDRGFVFSDHADWPALLQTIEESGARRVLLTHGHAEELARFLAEHGLDARAIATRFHGEAGP